MLPGNKDAIEAWNTILFEKFVKFRPIIVDGLSIHGTRAMDMHPPRRGATVVDIGCGFGDTTAELARRIGPEGRAVGVDAAARFIETARGECREPNATFEVLDVEEAVTGGPYDHAFSRFGTMFFNAPVIALRNIRKAMKPGGQLCMVVWRRKDANEVFYAAELVVREILGDPPKGDAVTCGPGPFSMSSTDVVSDQLLAAGWRDIAFTRSDADIMAGRTIDEAVDFAMTIGPAGEVIRLAKEEGVRRRDAIIDGLRKAMAKYERPDGIWAPSTVWIVTATA